MRRAVVALLLFCAGLARAADFPFESLHPAGAVPKSNRINVLFVSDGYTREELDGYRERVRELVRALLEERPYKEYANFFTFTRIDNAPPDGPVTGTTLSTGEDVDLEVNKVWSANPALPRHVVVMLVNGWRPGSFCYGRNIVLSEVNDLPGLVSLLSHELGHALGQLYDEDSVDGPGPAAPLPPEEELSANITRESDASRVKWKSWIESKILGNPVAGGMGRSSGLYRPKETCRMKYASAAPFCEVCVEEHIRRFYTNVSLLEPWTPADEIVRAGGAGQPVTVAVSCVAPTPATSVIGEWSLDGRMLEGKGTRSEGPQGPRFEIVLEGAQMTPGTHDLKFVVTDKTTLVKDAKEDDPIYRRRPNIRKWAVKVPASLTQLPVLRRVATSLAE